MSQMEVDCGRSVCWTPPCRNKRSPYSLGVIRYGSVSSDFSVNPRPPNAPGVYMFLGADDRILYVGMAHDLEKVLYRYKGLKGRQKFRDRLAASEFGRVAWIVASQSETPATLERIAITRFRPPWNDQHNPQPRTIPMAIQLGDQEKQWVRASEIALSGLVADRLRSVN